MDIAVPIKLKHYLTPEKNIKGKLFCLSGQLKCDCGCAYFKLFYAGRCGGFFAPLISKAMLPGGKRLIIVAKCLECSNEITVYDSMTDGRSLGTKAPTLTQEMSAFKCTKCSALNFSANIELDYLTDAVPDWQDKFSTIRMSVSCPLCKSEYDNLVND